jgi:hypothetical protein
MRSPVVAPTSFFLSRVMSRNFQGPSNVGKLLLGDFELGEGLLVLADWLIHHLARGFAAHVADLAFQVADAGFARVVLDEALMPLVGEVDLLAAEARRSICLRTRKRLAISIFSSSV